MKMVIAVDGHCWWLQHAAVVPWKFRKKADADSGSHRHCNNVSAFAMLDKSFFPHCRLQQWA